MAPPDVSPALRWRSRNARRQARHSYTSMRSARERSERNFSISGSTRPRSSAIGLALLWDAAKATAKETGNRGPIFVGSFTGGASLYSVMGMAGNVAE